MLFVVLEFTDVDLGRVWVRVCAIDYVSFVPFSLVQWAIAVLEYSITFWKIIADLAPVNASIHSFDCSLTDYTIGPTTLDHLTIEFVRKLTLTMRS